MISNHNIKAKFLGKYHLSDNKKYTPVIVLVHHFGGVPEQLKYHVEFLNQNGFDAYTYPAFLHGKNHWKQFFPMIKKTRSGVVKIWTEELEQHLNQLTGDKVIFSFSFPSVAALLAIPKRNDIKALICDGGPFSNLSLASWRFFTYYHQVTNIFLKIYLTGKMCMAFKALSIKKKIRRNLSYIPKDFPILSLQSIQDQQVPPSAINQLLEKMKQVHLTICQLKHSSHLEGLKKERKFYIENVLRFLERI